MTTDNKSQLPEDLRRFDDTGHAIGGAASNIEVSVKGEQRRYWYAVGDAAQAINRIEQDLRDNCTGFREMWVTGGGSNASGLLCIADDPIEAVRMFVEGGGPGHRVPYFMLDLNRSPSRDLLAHHLGEGLGKYGTADL